jgi:nitrite reductase (NADH) large subunit
MRRLQLVMVGNGMAGVRTLEELLAAAPERYDITVFGAEPHPNYNRILLSPVLSGETRASEIVLNNLEWYWSHGIRLHLGKRVTQIDRKRRFVVAADGTEAPYDRLLLATGSNPYVLPVAGCGLQGVRTYRDLDDTGEIIGATARYRRAVVIGGGLLGLEAANGLRARGMEVTVVHVKSWLMERQLDETAAALLKRALEARGIQFRLSAQTLSFLPGRDGRVGAVQLADGTHLPAELVVMAVGIRPNIELAQKAGLHCDRGIVVSDTMQTFDPRIYAVGECVAHRGVGYGLVEPLYEMGKVCANHLAGSGIGHYAGSIPSTRLKVTGIELFSAGNFTGGDGTETITMSDPECGIYRKVVLKDGRVAGALFYGTTAGASWMLGLMREKRDVTDIRDALLFGPEAVAQQEPEDPAPAEAPAAVEAVERRVA